MRQTNKQFSKTNKHFKYACEFCGIAPTQRQASKWRRGLGEAKRKSTEQVAEFLEWLWKNKETIL